MSFPSFGTYLDLYVSLRDGGDLRDYNQLYTYLRTDCNGQFSESVNKEVK